MGLNGYGKEVCQWRFRSVVSVVKLLVMWGKAVREFDQSNTTAIYAYMHSLPSVIFWDWVIWVAPLHDCMCFRQIYESMLNMEELVWDRPHTQSSQKVHSLTRMHQVYRSLLELLRLVSHCYTLVILLQGFAFSILLGIGLLAGGTTVYSKLQERNTHCPKPAHMKPETGIQSMGLREATVHVIHISCHLKAKRDPEIKAVVCCLSKL